MSAARKSLCVLVGLALFVAPVTSGCANTEPSAASAVVQSGLLGSLGESLKREDDEAELKEIREAPVASPEEREEAREDSEAAVVAAANAREPTQESEP